VVRLCEQPNNFEFAYDVNMTIKEKIEAIAKKIYRADAVSILPAAQKQIEQLEKLGLDKVPVCMAKTQYSFSDDPALLGAPKGWTLTVRNIKISAGAGFILALTGEIMTMPGLSPVPAAEKIDVDNTGKISGLF
jgi:formate--tetrahydrofolate ligase